VKPYNRNNIFLEQKSPVNRSSSAITHKRAKILKAKKQINNELADHYKWRIANFVEEMTEKPIR